MGDPLTQTLIMGGGLIGAGLASGDFTDTTTRNIGFGTPQEAALANLALKFNQENQSFIRNDIGTRQQIARSLTEDGDLANRAPNTNAFIDMARNSPGLRSALGLFSANTLQERQLTESSRNKASQDQPLIDATQNQLLNFITSGGAASDTTAGLLRRLRDSSFTSERAKLDTLEQESLRMARDRAKKRGVPVSSIRDIAEAKISGEKIKSLGETGRFLERNMIKNLLDIPFRNAGLINNIKTSAQSNLLKNAIFGENVVRNLKQDSFNNELRNLQFLQGVTALDESLNQGGIINRLNFLGTPNIAPFPTMPRSQVLGSESTPGLGTVLTGIGSGVLSKISA